MDIDLTDVKGYDGSELEAREQGAAGWRHPLVGYFTSAEQTEPEYDPPHDGPCLICWKPLHADDVRTISLRLKEVTDTTKSVFFRLHRSCADADPEAAKQVEHAVIEGEIRVEAPALAPQPRDNHSLGGRNDVAQDDCE